MTRTLEIRDGDVVIARSTGKLAFIENKTKARQSMRRLLNLAAPRGAGIDEVIGTVPESSFALSAQIQRNVRRAFDELSRAQRGAQLIDRTAEERLSSLARMYVVPARINGVVSSTGYAMRVDVLTVAGESVTIGFQLATPQGG